MLRNNYEIEEGTIEIIRDRACQDNNTTVGVGTSFDELKVDSITFIEIIIALEDKFEIEFDDEALYFGKFEYVCELVDYVNKLVNGRDDE